MAGNGINEDARYAGLSQRVTGIEASVNNLSQQFSNFVAKLDDRSRTPWGILVSSAVAILAYVTTIGGLAYAPVWSAISRQEVTQQALLSTISKISDDNQAALAAVRKDFVSQQELKWRTDRAAEDRARLDDNLADIRSKMVPRDELARVEHTGDAVDAQLQKQIDELKAEYQRGRPTN